MKINLVWRLTEGLAYLVILAWTGWLFWFGDEHKKVIEQASGGLFGSMILALIGMFIVVRILERLVGTRKVVDVDTQTKADEERAKQVQPPEALRIDDIHAHLKAVEEFSGNEIDEALWLKAVSNAIGDIKKQREEYIKLRVTQLTRKIGD